MNLNKHSLITEMTFDAAHRLSDYRGKCRRIHGHIYKVFVEVSGESLNEWGALIDFGDLKRIMKEKIDDKYDHRILFYEKDEVNHIIADSFPEDDWVVWMDKNTTAENIAMDIFMLLKEALKEETNGKVIVDKVTVYETPTNGASYKENL